MKYQIGFKNLPFKPDSRQVIYIENIYNEEINDAILSNIDAIRDTFSSRKFDFVYIPFLGADKNIEERVRYHAPYLTSDITYDNLPQSSLLLDCMTRPENRSNIPPSFIIYGFNDNDEEVFHAWSIEMDGEWSFTHLIWKLAYEISDYNDKVGLATNAKKQEDNVRFSYGTANDSDDGNVRCSKKYTDNTGYDHIKYNIEPELPEMEARVPAPKSSLLKRMNQRISRMAKFRRFLDEDFGESNMAAEPISDGLLPYEDEIPIEDIMDDLQYTVKRLQLKGITLAAIHELIDKQERLSRMVITEDYRIFLPDYNNIEIEMFTLPKALFFLFLRYPKGIVLKTMPDYYTELFNIYRQLKPSANEEKTRVTITKLCNPLGNAINENIARIRAAFVKKFDEHLAQNYFVKGTKGEEYGVSLDRNLIEWQEE